jgi:hypothetical protein
MATTTATAVMVMVMVMVAMATAMATAAEAKKRTVVLSYYTQQQFGVNEFGMVAAAVPAVNGTRTGVGLEVVYSYAVTAGPSPSSAAIGSVRGTSVVASNTANATFFVVKTVVRIADPVSGLSGTFSTQGEADFGSGLPFELAVVGGTADFRGVSGFSVARTFNFTPPTATSTAKVTNFYQTTLTWP